jgi:hypothetical protein
MDLNDAQSALQQLEQQTARSGSSGGTSPGVRVVELADVYYPLIAQNGKAALSGKFNHLNIHSSSEYTIYRTHGCTCTHCKCVLNTSVTRLQAKERVHTSVCVHDHRPRSVLHYCAASVLAGAALSTG